MPMPPKDITGQRFGKLVALRLDGKYRNGKGNAWLCACDCGGVVRSNSSQLERGERKSCGCNKREKRKPRPDVSERNRQVMTTHAMSGTATYRSWTSMRQRCNDVDDKDYANYGGRGITVCERWNNSFAAFFQDMGERPEGHTIDRINNNGNYEPGNCRWAKVKTQSNNTRKNYYVEYMGRVQTAKQWAEELKIVEYKTLLYRLRTGWDTHEAMTTPSTIKRK